jgi:broad specificity phosphatase PhoE
MKRASYVAIVLVALSWPSVATAQKLVYVVRHAERADGGVVATASAGSMQAPADPLLSPAGTARAQKLAAMLKDAGIKAIFVTEFRRTQDTARPLATKLAVTPEQIASNDTATLVAKLKAGHANDIVLVVGHSNTIPDIIKAFGGPAVTLGDDEYDNLFVIVPATGVMTRIRF